MIRFFDILFSLIGLIFLSPILLIVLILAWFDTKSPLFLQIRVGQYQKPFTLIKFRTMAKETEAMATHLVNRNAVTPFGGFLRRTKIDELPQLWNVLKGDISLVGPRPCLFNQTELIDEREQRGVYKVLPGITGLAQIQGIDMSDPHKLAKTDMAMLETFGLKQYFTYIAMTMMGKGAGDRIK